MIVFVEIPVIGRNACGFFNTVYEQFIDFAGTHAVDSLDELRADAPDAEVAAHCESLIPEGFFERTAEERDALEDD